MDVPTPPPYDGPSAEREELIALFDGMGEEDSGLLEYLGITCGCGDEEDDEVPLNQTSYLPLPPLPPSYEGNREDEEAVMNFFDNSCDGSEARGSEPGMAALEGVRVCWYPHIDLTLSVMQVGNLCLEEQNNLDWQRLSDEWETETGSRTTLQQPLRSERGAGDAAEAMMIGAAQSQNRNVPHQVGPAVVSHTSRTAFALPTAPPHPQRIQPSMFKQEPNQSMFKCEPIQTAPAPPVQPQMLPQTVGTVSWFNAAASVAQPYSLVTPTCNAFCAIDFSDQQRQDSKRSRSPPNQVHVVPAAPELVADPMMPPAMTWQAAAPLSKRTKPSVDRDVLKVYVCGYCGRHKTSISRCADGRVRIRCQCGGQHKDGKPRMHATWTLAAGCNSDSGQGGWIFVDDTHDTHKQQDPHAAIANVAAM